MRRTREQEGSGGEQAARGGDSNAAKAAIGTGAAAGPAEAAAEEGGDAVGESPTVIVDLVLGEGQEGVERVVLTRRSDLDAVSAALGRKHGLQPALVGALRSALGREQAKAWEV